MDCLAVGDALAQQLNSVAHVWHETEVLSVQLTHGTIAKNPTPERSSMIEFGAIDHQADGAVRIGRMSRSSTVPEGELARPQLAAQ